MKEILDKLTHFWQSNQLDFAGSTTLLAVSGGKDSMLLAHLFLANNFPFAIAHMNYQLRGDESEKDATFVQDWAIKHNIPFHLKVDNLKAVKEQNIQIAAREARYDWFEELLEKNSFTFLATAHHLQDSIETTLINLGRGTGLKGLTGIPVLRRNIVRPLLCLSPSEKKQLCDHYQLSWREDQSNASDKYLRNKIRHQIIPELLNIFPNFFQSQELTKKNIQSDFKLIEELINNYGDKMIRKESQSTTIDLSIIENHPERNHLLYYLLQPWEFSSSQIQQLWNCLPSNETKFFSTTKTNGNLKGKILILDNTTDQEATHYSISEHMGTIETTYAKFEFKIVTTPDNFGTNKNEAFFDLDEIEWPLDLRIWKTGDTFQPFGMGGKHQKLQDFFSNNKYNQSEKKAQLLLCSKGQIMWIVAKRSSQEFAVKPGQSKCLKVTWLPH